MYRMDLHDRARERSFGIVVDEETMTWISDPPGIDIAESIVGYFGKGGPLWSGKQVEILPGGFARSIE